MATVELLAPAGTLETFYAALEGGADAVYAGAPGFNARNLAKDLRIEEIGAMIRYCHDRDKKIYIAANSLILEKDIGSVISTLALLEELQPDALIVQDLGLLYLVKKYFPTIKLHGSTLMTVHNSEGVRFLGDQGCERVVLARELTLKEIETINQRSGKTELEVFIHGAMCFSYSGLCLFSSYLGGKSGLRGRCVQPCRRAYTSSSNISSPKWKKKRGGTKKAAKGKYSFSMNDLSGLEAVSSLKKIGVSSLKVEGRLRSAHYVRNVIKAYRIMLDSEEGDQDNALIEAQDLVDNAMSRNTSSGYFFTPQPEEAITSHHSGNIGLHLGKFSGIKEVKGARICRFVVKKDIAIGDRLRLHVEPSGERASFRIKSLYVQGANVQKASAGERISVELPGTLVLPVGAFVEVYKVDSGAQGFIPRDGLDIDGVSLELRWLKKKTAPKIGGITDVLCKAELSRNDESTASHQKKKKQDFHHRGRSFRAKKRLPIEWWLKTDSPNVIFNRFPFAPDRYLLNFEKQLLSQAGKIKKELGPRSRIVSWSLPPLIMENDIAKVKRQIFSLMRTGFRSFQLGHISQVQLFQGEKVHLFGDYSLNVMNSLTVSYLQALGIGSVQAAIELDKQSLEDLIGGYRAQSVDALTSSHGTVPIGLYVYGSPPLYTARLASNHFEYGKRLESPKKEPFVIRKKEGFTQTFPETGFSLLPYLEELQKIGLGYVVVDTCNHTSRKNVEELGERLKGTGRYRKLPTFNYLGHLE